MGVVRHQGVMVCLAAGLLGAAAPWAWAGPRQEAADLLRKGNELNQLEDRSGALNMYRAAYRLYPSYKIRFNIGSTLYALGRHREAAETLDEFLAESGRAAPAPVVADARRMLGDLEGRLASVLVSCPVEAALVKVRDHEGEKALGFTPMKRRRFLLPGSYRLAVEKKGHHRFALELNLKPGDHAIVKVPLYREAVPSLTMDRAAPTSPGASSDGSLSGRATAGYATLAVGLGMVATAGVLYGMGGSEGSEAHDQYKAAETDDEMLQHRQTIEAARTKLVAGHVLAGVGLAAVGASIYLLLTDTKKEKRATTLGAAPLPGGGVVGVTGTF